MKNDLRSELPTLISIRTSKALLGGYLPEADGRAILRASNELGGRESSGGFRTGVVYIGKAL